MPDNSACREPHVLLVEDNPGDILLVRESFREFQTRCRLSVVNDGQQALDFMYGLGKYPGALRPDLILLDLNLPKVSGHDVLAHVKGSIEFRDIPVVVLTTSRAPADIHRAYGLAANCYLSKPNGLEEFFHQMRLLLEFWLNQVVYPSGSPLPE